MAPSLFPTSCKGRGTLPERQVNVPILKQLTLLFDLLYQYATYL